MINKQEREVSRERSPNVKKHHLRESMKGGACLCCQQVDGMLLKVKTTDADDNVKQMAIDLQDVVLF